MKETLFLRGPACEGLITQVTRERFDSDSAVTKVADKFDRTCKFLLYPHEERNNSTPAVENGYDFPSVSDTVEACGAFLAMGEMTALIAIRNGLGVEPLTDPFLASMVILPYVTVKTLADLVARKLKESR